MVENLAKAGCKYPLNFAHIVVSDQKIVLMNVQGKCGEGIKENLVRTEMFKFVTTDYTPSGNLTTEYVIHDTNRQVSMDLSNFN